MKINELMKEAKRLEKLLCTEWADENEDEYEAFATRIETEYAAGRISAHEFNELALTAFFDYLDLKDDEEECADEA